MSGKRSSSEAVRGDLPRRGPQVRRAARSAACRPTRATSAARRRSTSPPSRARPGPPASCWRPALARTSRAAATRTARRCCGAASWGHTAVLRALLAAGADPDLAEADGFTPLAWAIAGRVVRVAESCCSTAGADPNRADGHGRTPLLHRGCRPGAPRARAPAARARCRREHRGRAKGLTPRGRLRSARAGTDVEAELRAEMLTHAPPGSTIETRHTICVHVT